MDEPCSALDPIATQRVEELIFELKKDYTIVIVTHNMQQAARVSDYTGFFDRGELIEFGETERIFTTPGARAHGSLHHREIRMSVDVHRHFHDELSHVKVRLLTMSGEAEAALGLAVEALLERDGEKARRVIAGDRVIDSMEVEIEEQCINLLALQQPMARDLRMLTSALKIANDLERVGDHAVNIAQSAERLTQARPIAPEPEIVEMARLARDMLSDALEAFIRGDAAGGREVCLRDDKVDALHRSVFRILLDPHDGRSAHDRRRHGALPGEPQSRAGGRPGHQHRRGRGLPGRGQVHQASRRGPRRGAGRPAPTLPHRARDRPARRPGPAPQPPQARASASPPSTSAPIPSACSWPSTIPPPASPSSTSSRTSPASRRGSPRPAASTRPRSSAPCRRSPGCARSASAAGVRRIAAVATAAVREAENGPWFVRRVRQELDIPLRIIDAETEAALSYRSVAHHFRLAGERTLVADIGGGSLELIGAVDGLVELHRLASRSARCASPSCTCPASAPARKEIDAAPGLRPEAARSAASPAASGRRPRSSASGGTFTSLGRMVQARRGLAPGRHRPRRRPSRPPKWSSCIDWLASRTPEQRRQVPGLNPERADIILAGLAVTAELLDWVRAREHHGERVRACARDCCWRWRAPRSRRRPIRCGCSASSPSAASRDRRHVEQVRNLALQLFDQLGRRARLRARGAVAARGGGAAARRRPAGELPEAPQAQLRAASCTPSGWVCRRASAALVALISRYHRRTGPGGRHPEFAALPPEDQAIVRRLSGLLRVADGLDRGHTAAVENVGDRARRRTRSTIRIAPRLAGADLGLECWGASRKADVLAKLLKRDVVISSDEARPGPSARSRAWSLPVRHPDVLHLGRVLAGTPRPRRAAGRAQSRARP